MKRFGTPGARYIYPTAAQSLSLAGCSIGAQLLFDRLIAASDDQGRQPGHPALVKANCFPLIDEMTSSEVTGLLRELDDIGMVIRYQADGEDLIQVRNWWDYQGAQRHIYPSRWPAPEGWEDRVKGHGAADSDSDDDGSGGQRRQSAADGRTKPSLAKPSQSLANRDAADGRPAANGEGGPADDAFSILDLSKNDPLVVACQLSGSQVPFNDRNYREDVNALSKKWGDDLVREAIEAAGRSLQEDTGRRPRPWDLKRAAEVLLVTRARALQVQAEQTAKAQTDEVLTAEEIAAAEERRREAAKQTRRELLLAGLIKPTREGDRELMAAPTAGAVQ